MLQNRYLYTTQIPRVLFNGGKYIIQPITGDCLLHLKTKDGVTQVVFGPVYTPDDKENRGVFIRLIIYFLEINDFPLAQGLEVNSITDQEHNLVAIQFKEKTLFCIKINETEPALLFLIP